MKTVPLGEVAEVNPRAPQVDGDEDVSFVGMAQLDATMAKTDAGATRRFDEVSRGYTVFQNSDILVAKITPCFENNKIGQAHLQHAVGVGSTEFHVVRPGELLDRRYVLHYLRQDRIRAQGELRMTGSAGQRRVPTTYLEQLPIPLPPLGEQRRIAAILDHADALRAKRRQVITHLDDLAQAIFHDMFGDSRPWPVRPLESVSEAIVDCPHSTPKWTESGEVCIRTSNLTKGGWDWSDRRYVSPDDYIVRSRRLEIKTGDIILSREGTVGIAAIVDDGMRICMGQRLVQVRTDSRIMEPDYVLRFILHALAPERITHVMVGSTARHLNVKELRALPIPVPPLELQSQFSARTSAIRPLISTAIRSESEIIGLTQSLRSRAFSGVL